MNIYEVRGLAFGGISGQMLYVILVGILGPQKVSEVIYIYSQQVVIWFCEMWRRTI